MQIQLVDIRYLRVVQMDVNKDREPHPTLLTIDAVTAQAKELLLKDGLHQPILIVEGVDQRLIVELSDLADTAPARQLQVFHVGVIIAQERLVSSLSQVFYVGEGWMSQQEAGDTPVVPPAETPNRVEVLMIAAAQMD